MKEVGENCHKKPGLGFSELRFRLDKIEAQILKPIGKNYFAK